MSRPEPWRGRQAERTRSRHPGAARGGSLSASWGRDVMIVLDLTVVNVALPYIQASL